MTMAPGRKPSYRDWSLWLSVLVGIMAIGFVAQADLRVFLGDDGGITFRYAERISQGKGFNYNDSETVNGASNPLFTLAVAGCLRLGLSPSGSLVFLATLSFAGVSALLFLLFLRYYSLPAAAFALLLWWSQSFLFDSLFTGLESPFVLILATLFFFTLHGDSPYSIGLILGLLVSNKLDGALAAIAFLAAYLVVSRRLPLRAASVALLTFLPMVITLVAVFGSIFPNSAWIKLSVHQTRAGFDPFWMFPPLGEHAVLLLMAPLSLLLLRSKRYRFSILTMLLWFVLHVLTYSTIDLGDPYPWYLVLPKFILLILSAAGLHAVYEAAGKLARQPYLLASSLAIVGLYALLFLRDPIQGRLEKTLPPDWLPDFEAGNLARQAAGSWLHKHTTGTELLVSPFGLPAYEYKGPVYDTSLLNSEEDPSRATEAAYHILPAGPRETLPSTRAGVILVGLFHYDPDARKYGVYATEGSEIVQKGVSHLPDEEGHFAAPLAPTDFSLLSRREAMRLVLVEQGKHPT